MGDFWGVDGTQHRRPIGLLLFFRRLGGLGKGVHLAKTEGSPSIENRAHFLHRLSTVVGAAVFLSVVEAPLNEGLWERGEP